MRIPQPRCVPARSQQSGPRAADCEEPPNPANVECRKCNEGDVDPDHMSTSRLPTVVVGHFAKDCPQGSGWDYKNQPTPNAPTSLCLPLF